LKLKKKFKIKNMRKRQVKESQQNRNAYGRLITGRGNRRYSSDYDTDERETSGKYRGDFERDEDYITSDDYRKRGEFDNFYEGRNRNYDERRSRDYAISRDEDRERSGRGERTSYGTFYDEEYEHPDDLYYYGRERIRRGFTPRGREEDQIARRDERNLRGSFDEEYYDGRRFGQYYRGDGSRDYETMDRDERRRFAGRKYGGNGFTQDMNDERERNLYRGREDFRERGFTSQGRDEDRERESGQTSRRHSSKEKNYRTSDSSGDVSRRSKTTGRRKNLSRSSHTSTSNR
jgi:hypothetical protein